MSGKVLSTWFVYIFFMTFYYNSEQTLAGHEVKQNLADVLNAHLGHSKWAHIFDVEVKSDPATMNECVSFSGKDLFIHRGLYSRNRNIGNSHVSVDNAYQKFYMVVYLLGCVYANVTDKFASLIKRILSVNNNERRCTRKRVRDKLTRRNRSKKKVQSDQKSLEIKNIGSNPEDVVSYDKKESKPNSAVLKSLYACAYDYERSWKIISFSFQQLWVARPMFAYMYDALNYLFSLIPTKEHVVHHSVVRVQKIFQLVEWYKDLPARLNRDFPNYTGVFDAEYKSKCGPLALQLQRTIDAKNQHLLKPFANTCCILRAKEKLDINKLVNKFRAEFPLQDKSDIIYEFGNQIRELGNEVVKNYYFALGFVNT